ncbi:membrane protein [Paractinoplanes deccanensis]|uniref:Membrane protein n=1 Tax=Paractinoplanes deccanensis TaxID=113561 RepID=A0ABQ3YF73_9ACTN|nr:glutaredoxin domain-containing protein [Actinoplanes deccanensis]GID78595.1 membrane protein [Actinoplanes deccanensis]
MVRRWGSSIVLAAAGLFLGGVLLAQGRVVSAVVVFVLFVAFAAVTSPPGFPRSVSDAEARAASARDGHAIVYWRPGCPYCARLRVSLGRRASRLHWVDIWADPAGAATVRDITGGDETVPTVVTPSESFVNPSPLLVRQLALH